MRYQGNWSKFLDFGFLNFLTPLGFRLRLMDWLTPLNYDLSRESAFRTLSPRPSEHVLDLGCGTGRLLLQARRWLETGGRLTGIDTDEFGLAFARRRAEKLGVSRRVGFQSCDMRNIAKLGVRTFDGVLAHFAVYVLPSAEDRRAVLQGIHGVLKPGGRFVSVVPNESYCAEVLLADAKRLESERPDVSSWVRSLRKYFLASHVCPIWIQIEKAMEEGVFHRYAKAEADEELGATGFKVIRTETVYGGCANLVAGLRL